MWTWRTALVGLSAVAIAHVHAAANLDDGFAQDGVTTYCQGVNGARGGPLEFNALEVHNAGRCPIDVTLSVKGTTVGTETPLEVQWAASVRAGDVAGNIFPRAVDSATKKPQDVIASLLRACKAGTNCAPDALVVPQVAGDGEETGPFDANGRKALRPFRFQFPAPGQYLIVGVVTLPGDNMLNVSASEFVTFQKITVVDGVGPATVVPAVGTLDARGNEVGAEAKTSNLNFQDNLLKSATSPETAPTTDPSPSLGSTPAPATNEDRTTGGVDASFSGTNKSGAAKTGGGSNLNTMLVIGAVAVVMVAVLLYFVVVRRKSRTVQSKDKRKPLDPHSEAGIFRLSGHHQPADVRSSLSLGSLGLPMQKQRANADSVSVSLYSGGSSERSLAPPRFTTTSQQSGHSSVDSGQFARPAPAPRRHRQPSRVSVASSGFSDFNDDEETVDVGTFGDLHDSSASLPTIPQRIPRNQQHQQPHSSRGSVASSVSSYGSEFDSVRGPSELNSFYSDRASEYDNDRRSTELGALSERGSRLDEYEV